MTSGYKQFTNEGCDEEGGGHYTLPSYDESNAIPSSAPPQNPYPPPNSSEYPMQQPSQSQHASQFPQQQPGTSEYPMQQPSQSQQASQFPQQQPGASEYPMQKPSQSQQASQFPQQQPGTSQYPMQQPSQYQQASQFPQQQPGTYAPQLQVVQVPVQQNIVHVSTETMPNDYFGLALFVTLCCCLPFGIVALVKSNEVRNRSAVGDYHGAAISSLEAKRWSRVGLLFGSISLGVCVLGGILSSALGSSVGSY